MYAHTGEGQGVGRDWWAVGGAELETERESVVFSIFSEGQDERFDLNPEIMTQLGIKSWMIN